MNPRSASEYSLRTAIRVALSAGPIQDPEILCERLAAQQGVMVWRAREIYKSEAPFKWAGAVERRSLRRQAAWLMAVGLGLLAIQSILRQLRSTVQILDPYSLDGILGVLSLVIVIIVGLGMAELAAAKGYSRANGFWVLIGPVGLLGVLFCRDHTRYLDIGVEPNTPRPAEDPVDTIEEEIPVESSDEMQGSEQAPMQAALQNRPKRRTPEVITAKPEARLAVSAGKTVADQLAKLSELRSGGHLSEEEFTAAKARILSSWGR